MEVSKKENFYLNTIKESLKKEKESGFVFFDVGCNKGFYTQNLIDIFGQNNTFHLFDASDRFLNISKGKFSGMDNIKLFNSAVSDSVGEIEFYELEDGDNDVEGMSSVNNRSVFKDYTSIKKVINSTTLDVFIEVNKVGDIDFIKIDTEGHELNVLKGMSKALSDKKIKFIQIEYGDCLLETGKNLNDIIDFLLKYEYKLFDESNGSLIEITKEISPSMVNRKWDNFLIKSNE
tara:strand:- start:1857 stop:2555 length:699 start_codon:yes stop_codon:yes gene_type:complete